MQFALFASGFEPSGGWGDFIASDETVDALKALINAVPQRDPYAASDTTYLVVQDGEEKECDWWQIVDLHELKMVEASWWK